MVNIDMEKYLPDFIVSVKSDLENINNELLGSNPDISNLHRLFHSLKGKFLFLGFTKTGQLARELEFLLNDIKNSSVQLSDELKKKISQTAKQIKISIQLIESTKEEPI